MYHYNAYQYEPFGRGFNLLATLFGAMGIFWMVVCVLFFILHLVIVVYVFRDARSHGGLALGLAPWMWALISLMVPFFGMFIYWLMNRSTLVQRT